MWGRVAYEQGCALLASKDVVAVRPALEALVEGEVPAGRSPQLLGVLRLLVEEFHKGRVFTQVEFLQFLASKKVQGRGRHQQSAKGENVGGKVQ